MKKSVPFILFILFITPAISQNFETEIDSSYTFLRDQYYLSKSSDSTKAKFYAKAYIKKAKTEKNISELITGHYFAGDIDNNWRSYLKLLDSLIKVTKKKPSRLYPANIYERKANLYIKYANYDESLKQYLLASKYANLYSNDSIIYILKQNVAVLKGINKEYKDEKKLLLEAYNFYEKIDQINSDDRFSLVLNLSNSYNNLKKYDSAIFFNNKAYELAVEMNDNEFKSYSLYLKSRIQYNLSDYSSCIKNMEKSLPNLFEDENYRAISNAYRLIIKSYNKLNNIQKVIEYCLIAEKFFEEVKITHSSRRYVLSTLYRFYKKKKNLNKQLQYVVKLLEVDSILNSRGDKLDKTFFEEYDKPKLIAEKQLALQELKKNRATSNKNKLFLGSIAVFAIFITAFQYNKRRLLKKRFKKLQEGLENNVKETQEDRNISSRFSLPEEKTSNILEQLDEFEQKNGFTDLNITLNSLAKAFKTNTNYLSKTINHFKGKGFSAYLTELRIDHALQLLQADSTVRKYTIKAIANEVGFKNAESFSKAFNKKTGLRPSYYIKEIQKQDARKK